MKTAPKQKGAEWPSSSFEWYWHEPFTRRDSNLYFDREHWWMQPDHTPSETSAWFELLRRHPGVGELFVGEALEEGDLLSIRKSERAILIRRNTRLFIKRDNNRLLYCLDVLGKRPWNKLSQSDQSWFDEELRKTKLPKGKDTRPLVLDLSAVVEDPKRSGTRVDDLVIELINADPQKAIKPNDKTRIALEAQARALGDMASQEYRDGRLVLSIRPDVTNLDDLTKQIRATVIAWSTRLLERPRKPGRSRFMDWLLVISEFEKSEDIRLSVGARRAYNRMSNHKKRNSYLKLCGLLRSLFVS